MTKKSGPISLPTIEGVDAASIPAAEGLTYYTGPLPPASIYRVRLRRMEIAPNRTHPDLTRVSWVAEIDEEHRKRRRYNGYTLRDGQNYDKTGLPYINRMLTAMGLDKRAFHGGGIKLDKSGSLVRKIGRTSVRDSAGLYFYVGTRRRKAYQSEDRELAFFVYSTEDQWHEALRHI